MERWYFHSTEVVCEMIAQEEWLGCQHDASPMSDIPGSTPVWALCIYSFWFSTYQNLCICVMFSKSIYSIKQHWWSLALFWLDEIQRKFSTTHEFLNVKIDTTDEYMFSFIYAFYRYKLWYLVLIDFRDLTRLFSLYIFILCCYSFIPSLSFI